MNAVPVEVLDHRGTQRLLKFLVDVPVGVKQRFRQIRQGDFLGIVGGDIIENLPHHRVIRRRCVKAVEQRQVFQLYPAGVLLAQNANILAFQHRAVQRFAQLLRVQRL
ncbi:hypothetical protein SDC9_191028 [bioreactor metagenome]|uniref:Uncharacterized protein n=1 Tax=bioreactor metagenome TaxID=1076179 RepID=A0A645HWS4_9ZZZZ